MPRPELTRTTAWLALLLPALLVLGLAAPAGAEPTPSPSSSTLANTENTENTEGTEDSPDPGDARPVVVIGMSGVQWADVSATDTPTLWKLGVGSAVGNLVVRSVRPSTCPADGWLALSAGARAADLGAAERLTDDSGLRCRVLVEADDGAVPGWVDYLAAAGTTTYDARLGLLGAELTAARIPATGIGPGAAIALARPNGSAVGTLLPRPSAEGELTDLVGSAVVDSQLVVIDAGTVRDELPTTTEEDEDGIEPVDPEGYRERQVAAIEQNAAEVIAGVTQGAAVTGSDPLVLVVSLADSGRAPALRLLAIDGIGPGTLTTASTRQPGSVQSTDLLPWLLRELGITQLATPGAAAALVGSPPFLVNGPATADAGAERVAGLVDADLHAQAQRPITAPFYLVLVILNVALFAVVALGLTRPAATRAGAWVTRVLRLDGRSFSLADARPRVLRALRIVSVAMASIPVSTFLANLLPWWRAGSPALAFVGATLAICAVVTAAALARPWRRAILVPMGIVSGLTAVVLAVDVLTGARLQISAIMGAPMLVGGRFYGFNNTSFTLFTTACILLAVSLTDPLVRRGRRRLAAGIIAVIGVVATLLDGAPSIGADFGGPPAIVPAFALLALMAAGLRVTWQRVVAVVLAGVAAVSTLAFVDYLRPPEDRTHLGRFVATVLDGGAWDVIMRKLEANLRILANNRPLTILAITGVALVVFVLARPVSKAITSPGGGRFAWLSSGAPISQMGDVAPMLRPGLVALAVALGIGFALNDSGIAIPAYGVAMAVPLLLAACASWMLTLDGGARVPADERAQEPSAG